MEEATEQPPHLILLDPSFLVYRKRRRKRNNVPYLKNPACRRARWTARYTPLNFGSSAS